MTKWNGWSRKEQKLRKERMTRKKYQELKYRSTMKTPDPWSTVWQILAKLLRYIIVHCTYYRPSNWLKADFGNQRTNLMATRAQCMISKSSFKRCFVWWCVCNKKYVFVISGIIKATAGECYHPRPTARLITFSLTSTLIIPDITKTSSNNWTTWQALVV